MTINRVVLFVLDSVGIGALPDSEAFGDIDVNTLGNIARETGGINLPNLQRLGLGNIKGIVGVEAIDGPEGAFGRSMEVSMGKDTTTGHWELAGLHLKEAFNTYGEGFPREVMDAFENAIGRKSLGNKAASGTEIIEELGQEHMATGMPIVYTSADSVFQIAAHEEIIPLEELYKMCNIAREIMMGEHAVARIIARPFIGKPGSFERTSNRRDFSLEPFDKTILDFAKEEGLDVVAIGKIEDIFNGKGITEATHTKDNMEGVDQTIAALNRDSKGIIFTNLVDFDSKYGHRRDPQGYKKALEEFDARVPQLLASLKPEDIIIFTADHGNDPTYKGSDHTREYIPIVAYGTAIKEGSDIGTRKSFADIAATISDVLNIPATGKGESFKQLIIK